MHHGSWEEVRGRREDLLQREKVRKRSVFSEIMNRRSNSILRNVWILISQNWQVHPDQISLKKKVFMEAERNDFCICIRHNTSVLTLRDIIKYLIFFLFQWKIYYKVYYFYIFNSNIIFFNLYMIIFIFLYIEKYTI